MIVYFSGTGNSRYVAQALAQELDEPITDAGTYIKQGKTAELESETPWIFVAPTYGWRLPRIFTDFLHRAKFSGNRAAYFVMTCGNDIGNAGYWNAQLCRGIKLVYRGVLGVLMPENYIAMFNAPDKEETADILAGVHPILATVAEYIRSDLDFPPTRTSPVDRLKSSLVNRMFYKWIIKAKPFYAEDSCNGCGDCVKACPLNNIKLVNQKPSWGDACTHCMACICGCPKEAIEYGKRSKGKPRYQCPDYQPQEGGTSSVRP